MRTTKKNRTESGNPSQIRRKTEPETNWPFIAAIHARQPTILRIPCHCPVLPFKNNEKLFNSYGSRKKRVYIRANN
jgi:hypothetical protein